jgi:hypothetical protein
MTRQENGRGLGLRVRVLEARPESLQCAREKMLQSWGAFLPLWNAAAGSAPSPRAAGKCITTYNVLEMLGGWEIARPYNFLLLPMVDPTFGYAFDRRASEKVLLIAAFSSKQESWFGMKCRKHS